jgi:alpha-amylase/alpha-mannosidase (GH57 family)
LARLYEEHAGELLTDPWAARDDSIEIWLDRDPKIARHFFQRHARPPMDDANRDLAHDLLDMQRHAMFMYTSCGWFFDDVGGLEGLQVLRYAGRAIQIAERALGVTLEERFLESLAAARSNLVERGDARRIYERFVLPQTSGRSRVGG